MSNQYGRLAVIDLPRHDGADGALRARVVRYYVKFGVTVDDEFVDQLRVCGSTEALGEMDPAKAVPLTLVRCARTNARRRLRLASLTAPPVADQGAGRQLLVVGAPHHRRHARRSAVQVCRVQQVGRAVPSLGVIRGQPYPHP